MAGDRSTAVARSEFRYFDPATTRWNDNDIYGHLNNVVHYALFDSAVNRWLATEAGSEPAKDDAIGLVVHTRCDYFAELAYPERLETGLSAIRIGESSVTYRLGLFRENAGLCAALGLFTHVYVDRVSRRPVALAAALRENLKKIAVLSA